MTEAEWLSLDNPRPMLEFFLEAATDRKLRLFACACCRAVWPFLTDKRSRKALEFAERYAEVGLARRRGRPAVFQGAWEATLSHGEKGSPQDEVCASRAALAVLTPDPQNAVIGCCCWTLMVSALQRPPDPDDERRAGLLREILGNPFRPVRLDPAVRTPTVVALAQAAYYERILPGGSLAPTAWRFSLTRSRTPAAPAGTPSITSAAAARTCAGAGRWTSASA